MSDRIAYVTARYPPMQSSGTYRVEAVLKHLPGQGFEITPITLPDPWMAQQAGLPLRLIGDPAALQPSARSDTVIRGLASVPMVRRVVREALIPDILALWARSVPNQLLDALHDVKLVYATAPPFSAMILAKRLASRLELPLVQEIRDPPSFNRRLRGRSYSWRRRMLRFEGKYLYSAEAMIAVTAGTRRRLLELHPELRAEHCYVVENGYPDLEVDLSLATRHPDRFTVTYVGSFQGGPSRRKHSVFNPRVLLPALKGLPAETVQLRIVGPVTDAQRRWISSAPGGERVEFLGTVPRNVAIAEVAAADLALILAEDDKWWIGRKVFEYIAFARRILAVIPADGDAAELLRAHEKATIVDIGDLNRLGDLIAAFYADWKAGIPHQEVTIGQTTVQSDRKCVAEIAAILRTTLELSRGPA